MENTEINETSNTLVEYYKSNIDVHIDYLLTLNNYQQISHLSYLDLAPVLESVREEMYIKVSEYTKTHVYADTINKLLVIDLSLILTAKGLEELIDYLGYNLCEQDRQLLTVANALNKAITNLPEVTGNTMIELTITSLIDDIKKLRPFSNLEIEGVPETFIYEYLRELGITYDKTCPLLKYVYDSISRLRSITIMLNHLNYTEVDDEYIEGLNNQFNRDLNISNVESLTKAIDIIIDNINRINKKNNKIRNNMLK